MGEQNIRQDLRSRHGNGACAVAVNPIDLFEGSVSERDFVCDQLEAIADDLPTRIDIRRILSAMQFLRLKLPAYHRDERHCLFPLLKRRASQSFGMNRIAAQMQAYQIDDEDYALEVADLLDRVADTQTIDNPDAAGYMLRGFFQSYRRYLDWQRLTVLPLAASVLSQADLDELFESIHWNRRTAGPPPLYLLPTGA
jgi:hypothetical protein